MTKIRAGVLWQHIKRGTLTTSRSVGLRDLFKLNPFTSSQLYISSVVGLIAFFFAISIRTSNIKITTTNLFKNKKKFICNKVAAYKNMSLQHQVIQDKCVTYNNKSRVAFKRQIFRFNAILNLVILCRQGYCLNIKLYRKAAVRGIH